jgi:hypothetical protein
MERGFVVWSEIEIKFLGRTINGSYAVSRDGLVTVRTPHDSKTARFAGWPPKIIAERLLRELAIAGKA